MKMKRKLLLKGLFNQKSRFVVSLASAVVGTAIVFILLTLYFDITNQFSNAFRSYGANLIFVSTDADHPLTDVDVKALQDFLTKEKVNGIAPYQYETVRLNQQPYLMSLTDMSQVELINTSWLVKGEWPRQKNEILVGKEIAEVSQLEVGSTVKIYTILDKTEDTKLPTPSDQFTVSGIVTTGGNEEQELFINREDGNQLFGKERKIELIEANLSGNKEQLDHISQKIHKHIPTVEGHVASRVSEAQDKVFKKITRLFLVVVLFVVLLVGLILSTTTYALISDRRKEISLKKALGAFEEEIGKEFIRENLITTSLGYVIGTLLGIIGTKWISIRVFLRESELYWQVFLLVGIILFIISLISTLVPLRNVKKITIEQILKGE